MKLLDSATARDTFEHELDRVRRWYGCYIVGYVVMPEHVHLLIREPELGADLWCALRGTITTRYIGTAGVEELLDMVFRVPDSAPVVVLCGDSPYRAGATSSPPASSRPSTPSVIKTI